MSLTKAGACVAGTCDGDGVLKSSDAGLTWSALDRRAADFFRKRQMLRVDATSTISTAVLSVYETLSGAFIGTLMRYDGSGYHGEFTWPVNPRNVTVRSNRCGVAASIVTVK